MALASTAIPSMLFLQSQVRDFSRFVYVSHSIMRASGLQEESTIVQNLEMLAFSLEDK